MLFLQETHSTLKDEVWWRDEFNADPLFSYSTSNSCEVVITIFSTNKVTVKKKISDTEGRFLIFDVEIAGVFTNLDNSKHGIQTN